MVHYQFWKTLENLFSETCKVMVFILFKSRNSVYLLHDICYYVYFC